MATGGKIAGRASKPAQPPAARVEAVETQIPLKLIREPADGRPIDPAHVANLAVSMSEIGQENAISVRLLKDSERGEDGCIYMRTRGGHRRAAAELLGWKTIGAKVRNERAEIAAMAEVDENLLRRDLTPLERAQAFAERLDAWAALHPERVKLEAGAPRPKKPGRPKNSDKLSAFLNGRPPLMGFSAETASQAGLSPRTIERALAVYRAIPAGQQARLHGTWIASNDAALRQLAGIADPAEQAAAIDVLLAGQTRNVAAARAIAAGADPEAAVKTPTRQIAAEFRKLWGKATPSQREEALHWLAGQRLPKGWTITGPQANGDG